MLHYGTHPFPADIEQMLRTLLKIDPRLLMNEDPISSTEMFDWEAGRNLEAGREKLKGLLAKHQS